MHFRVMESATPYVAAVLGCSLLAPPMYLSKVAWAHPIAYLFGFVAVLSLVNLLRLRGLPPLLESSSLGLKIRRPASAAVVTIPWKDLKSVEVKRGKERCDLEIESSQHFFRIPRSSIVGDIDQLAADIRASI